MRLSELKSWKSNTRILQLVIMHLDPHAKIHCLFSGYYLTWKSWGSLYFLYVQQNIHDVFLAACLMLENVLMSYTWTILMIEFALAVCLFSLNRMVIFLCFCDINVRGQGQGQYLSVAIIYKLETKPSSQQTNPVISWVVMLLGQLSTSCFPSFSMFQDL